MSLPQLNKSHRESAFHSILASAGMVAEIRDIMSKHVFTISHEETVEKVVL